MTDHRGQTKRQKMHFKKIVFWLLCSVFCSLSYAFAEELNLQSLIDEALQNNHDILTSGSRAAASKFRIPQATSLADPMFTFGYQNEGWKKYTYGEMQGAQWMFSLSQSFPFPGKLPLKGEMAAKDADSLHALYASAKLKTIARVKELYYDLFFTYKNIDVIKEKTALFSKIEDAALARYSSGKGLQQEVLMAQTEKYMLLEKEEMLKQRVQSIEAMLNATVGRDVDSPLGRPAEPLHTLYVRSMTELISLAQGNSPEIKAREKMVASAGAKVKMAQKEYYPDFTITGSVFQRSGEFQDMWSLTTTVNIPIFYRTKQKQAVHEAGANLSEAMHELEGVKVMLASSIRDNFSMLKTAEKLMELYTNGLIPKTHQDFESALSGYKTGRVEAITVISRLKAILDFEVSYWGQFTEREKAIARLEALTGGINNK